MVTSVTQMGKDTRLEVSDGTATPNYLPIAGEQKLSRKSTSKEIDTGSKDDGIYETGSYGQKTVGISANGITKLPDAGYSRVYAVQKMAVPNTSFRMVNTLTNEVMFEAVMSVGNFNDDYDKDQGTTWSFDLKLAQAPVTDIVPTGQAGS